MDKENKLIELFVNQIIRTKQICTFIKDSNSVYNEQLLINMFKNKRSLNVSDLYELVKSQIGEEESNIYLNGLYLVNEYLVILSTSYNINSDKINNSNNNCTSNSNNSTIDNNINNITWDISAIKHLIYLDDLLNINYQYEDIDKNYIDNDRVPYYLKLKFTLVNLLVLYSSMFVLLKNKKQSLSIDSRFSVKDVYNYLDFNKDGLITAEDINYLFSKHKVNFNIDDIRYIFLLNKMPKINNNIMTLSTLDYFDYKSFKGFFYLFSKANTKNNFKCIDLNAKNYIKENKVNNLTNNVKESTVDNKINNKNSKKLGYSTLKICNIIIGLSQLEESLNNLKDDYVLKGELSLIHLFQCFDIDNNEFIVLQNFVDSLSFLGISDYNMIEDLYVKYSNNNKISYLNFVELLLPASPDKAIKISRKESILDYNKSSYFESNKYYITKNILKLLFQIHISIQRYYIQIKEQCIYDKNFNIEEGLKEINLHLNKTNSNELNLYNNKEMTSISSKSFVKFANSILDIDPVDVNETYINIVFQNINKKTKEPFINLNMFIEFFDLNK